MHQSFSISPQWKGSSQGKVGMLQIRKSLGTLATLGNTVRWPLYNPIALWPTFGGTVTQTSFGCWCANFGGATFHHFTRCFCLQVSKMWSSAELLYIELICFFWVRSCEVIPKTVVICTTSHFPWFPVYMRVLFWVFQKVLSHGTYEYGSTHSPSRNFSHFDCDSAGAEKSLEVSKVWICLFSFQVDGVSACNTESRPVVCKKYMWIVLPTQGISPIGCNPDGHFSCLPPLGWARP